jgi:putative ABC transport system permease protein
MFFVTYLRSELRHRKRQATFIALGLALGVGLVMTVSSASAGVKNAQTDVLGALYGVGTNVTVTGQQVQPGSGPAGRPPSVLLPKLGPHGAEICAANGKCTSAAGQTVTLVNPPYAPMSGSKVAEVAGLHGVAAAAGGLTLVEELLTFPEGPDVTVPSLSSVYVDGVDSGHSPPGPLSAATFTSGHGFTEADSDAADAIVDSGYATSHRLKVGSTLDISQVSYTVIGIVDQPQGSTVTDVYLPLQRAQAITTNQLGGSLNGQVNTIYVSASSGTDIPPVHKEISGLLPGVTVTTASSLASEVTGSLTSAAKLADDLGTWLSVLVLIAAFALAILLTMASVTRRAPEFGTLKAIGWRTRRIVAQVLGESLTVGAAGAVAGVALGVAGARIIDLVAPTLPAVVNGNFGPVVAPVPGGKVIGPSLNYLVPVPVHASVTLDTVAEAVALAVLGGLLAGAFASWRIARLRPSAALARVA